MNENFIVTVRFMSHDDLTETSRVHAETFARQKMSREWLECNLNAFPRFMSFVIEVNNLIVGYITWSQKSGFRPQTVLELEQNAVLPAFQGGGMGEKLIRESLPFVRQQLIKQESNLKHIIITTRADNKAQRLYEKTLGAKVEATIRNLYSADEVFMVVRNL